MDLHSFCRVPGILLIAVCPFGSAAEQTYDVGVATVDVTPEYPVRLNGFASRKSESEGVSQAIRAGALAIGSDAESPAVLITLDSLGVRMTMVEEVARRVAARTGLDSDRLTLTFTHTHSAPKVNGAADNIFAEPIPAADQAHIDRYTAELTDALERVALAALADRRPALLSHGTGRVDFAVNRRTPGGPVDHSLPVLVVRSPDGQIRAVYTSYACHCVTLSQNLISGDWAGYARESLERRFPGATGLVSIGCGSDQNPSSGVTGDRIGVAEQQGLQIADEVARVVQAGLRPVEGPLNITRGRIALAFSDLPTRDEYMVMAAQGGAAGYNAQTQLARMDRGDALPVALDYPIQTWSFGESLCLIFLGGEVCVDYAIRLRQELDADRLWIHGYSNDFGAYIPSERLLREGGYGGGAEIPYFALPAPFRSGLEQQIIDEVRRQVPRGYHLTASAATADVVPPGTNGVPPLQPTEAVRSLRTLPHLRVELVAAEPLVADPVAIDFGPDGRIWVTEMTDYARGVEEEFEPTGRIVVLTDVNGDGRSDESAVFLDGLRFPTDVKVWRRGALICDAPDILYAEDTDGDGRADVRRVLFTGFGTQNGQARVNSLQWGLDNWVYGSCGLFGGVITNEHGVRVDVTGRDFRIRPDTGEIEPVTGRTQQSRVRDDWGNWFGCDNGTLVRHYPVDEHYAAANPWIAPPPTSVFVPSGPNAGRLFPAGDLVLFKLSGAAGIATSACGVGIYRDDLAGPSFSGNALTCEPVNQLVHREVLSRHGATFRGHRAVEEQTTEFLTSADRWFRPVQVRTGPDGAIWVVDMYRYVIEHPRWIPDETLADLNVFAGQGMGRIYRVVPAAAPLRTVPKLDGMPPVELVAALDTPNGVQRDLIHQLLLWNRAVEVADELAAIAHHGRNAAARLSALSILDGLQVLREEHVVGALSDHHPELRRHAIRLSEQWLSESAALSSRVLTMADDSAFEVRLQLAHSLRFCRGPESADTLVRLATDSTDEYMTFAALSSLNSQNLPGVLRRILADEGHRERLGEPILATAAGLGDADVIRQVFTALLQKGEHWRRWQFRLTAQLLDGLDRREPAEIRNVAEEFRPQARNLLASAAEILSQSDAAEDFVLAAVSLLGRPRGPVSLSLLGPSTDGDLTLLAERIVPRHSANVQSSAIQALVRLGSPRGGTLLLSRLESATPAVRREIISALLSQNQWRTSILDALQQGQLTARDLDATQREQLLSDRDEAKSARAGQLLAATGQGSRRELVEQWRDVALLSGDPAQGRDVFGRRCAACHRLEGKGHAVGPDLAALTSRSVGSLITAILDPSRDVDDRYQGYLAVTDEGRTFPGLLVGETATSITLRQPEGQDQVLLRNRLEELRATGKSAMPEGLENDLSKQDLANLIAFLQSSGPAPRVFPGNRPELIRPDSQGTLLLAASTAAIFGDEIAFESDSVFQNIGYWHGARDHVSWAVLVEQDAALDVWIEYACDDATAGNELRIDGGDPLLRHVLAGTGGWDQYRTIRIGRIQLKAGQNSIALRPGQGFRGQALLDLKSVRLVPAGSDLPVDLSAAAHPAAATDPSEIARLILDESQPTDRREALAADLPQHSAAVMTALVADLPDDLTEEYRRIPWIWRVSIAAGRRNQSHEILAILEASLPAPGQPLRDWQAVVIGGGIVNGLSLVGIWPRERLDRLIAGNYPLEARWERTVGLASAMADDDRVRTGTRYDALRIIAMESWQERGAQLTKYLAPGVDSELQMGAVSGLADMPAADAGRLLVENIAHFSEHNRSLAMDALLRTGPRARRLLDAVEQGIVSVRELGAERVERLRQHSSPEIRSRALMVFGAADPPP